jgi:hypothetical protein
MKATSINWKHRLIDLLPERLEIALYASWIYRKQFGRWPNLLRPRTIAEAIQARKVWDRDPRLPQLADKLRVKDYVSQHLGADWVIPTLWSGKSLPPVAERSWPKPFVIKVNAGCGWNIFVHDDAGCDWPAIEAQLNGWMSSPYAATWGEWLYKPIDRMILVEPFVNFDAEFPTDYKFWVFHGRVAFICAITNRRKDHDICATFFSRDWQRLPVDLSYPTDPAEIPRPSSLEAMISAAEKLAADIPFVRVDLYEIDGRPLFGEMTFYPSSGLRHFNPPEFDQQMLRLWRGAPGHIDATAIDQALTLPVKDMAG